MKNKDVKIGEVYVVRVSGVRVPVRLISVNSFRGFDGLNLKTGRNVHIKSARRLQRKLVDIWKSEKV